MSATINYPVTDPQWDDTKKITLDKILQVTISGGGGGAGTNYNLDGAVDPTTDPADTSKTWHYTNTVTGTFWVWPAGGSAWQQIV